MSNYVGFISALFAVIELTSSVSFGQWNPGKTLQKIGQGDPSAFHYNNDGGKKKESVSKFAQTSPPFIDNNGNVHAGRSGGHAPDRIVKKATIVVINGKCYYTTDYSDGYGKPRDVPAPFPPAAQNPMNLVQSFNAVKFPSGTVARKQPNGTWNEFNANGQVSAIFAQVNEDGFGIVLRDSTRGMTITIPKAGGTTVIRYDQQGPNEPALPWGVSNWVN